MKKGVEVYFVIYLATIISFFALEGEVKNYKKRQNNILLEISREKIQQLVNIERVEPLNERDTLTLNVKLTGFYDRNSLTGSVKFTPVGTEEYSDASIAEELEFKLEPLEDKSMFDWYYSKIPKEVFGISGNIPFNVSAEILVTPEFNQQVRQRWFEAYKDEKIVNKLIQAIGQVGQISLSKTLPNAIVPSGGGNSSPFTMQAPKEVYSVLEGLMWEVSVFIGGVKDKSDFLFEIIEGSEAVSQEIISTPETKLMGLGTKDDHVKIIGTRISDNEKAIVEFDIRVRPPIWIRTPTVKLAYMGEHYTFDGSLLDIPSGNMQIKVTGNAINMERLIPGAQVSLGPFESEGELTFQVLVNGIVINNMVHQIEVTTPPEPEIKLIDREPKLSNNLIFEIITYGKINKVVSFQQRGGIIRNQQLSDPDIRGSKKYHRWLVEIEEPYEDSGFQEISFKVWDNYKQFTEHRKQYQFNY